MVDSLDLKCWDLVEKYLMLILDGGLRHPPVNPLRATHPYSYLPHKYTKYHRCAPRYQIHITKYQKMNWRQLNRTHICLTNTQNTTDMLPNINSYLPHKQGPTGRGFWLRDGTGHVLAKKFGYRDPVRPCSQMHKIPHTCCQLGKPLFEPMSGSYRSDTFQKGASLTHICLSNTQNTTYMLPNTKRMTLNFKHASNCQNFAPTIKYMLPNTKYQVPNFFCKI